MLNETVILSPFSEDEKNELGQIKCDRLETLNKRVKTF